MSSIEVKIFLPDETQTSLEIKVYYKDNTPHGPYTLMELCAAAARSLGHTVGEYYKKEDGSPIPPVELFDLANELEGGLKRTAQRLVVVKDPDQPTN